MRSFALALTACALVLAIVILWQMQPQVQTSERVTRDAPLSLWDQSAN